VSEYSIRLLEENNRERQDEIYREIKTLEKMSDESEAEIEKYLTRLAEDEISHKTSAQIRTLLNIVGDLERIGDLYVQMTKVFERKREGSVYFLPEQRQELKDMFRMINDAFAIMMENLEKQGQEINISTAKKIEQKINAKRNELKKIHQEGIESGDFSSKSAAVYAEIYTLNERIGDHILKVSEAMADIKD